MRPLLFSRPCRAALFALALALAAGPARAHDTWLRAEPGTLKAGQGTTLFLTSGGKFPENDRVIAPSRIEKSGCRLGGEAVEPTARTPRGGALELNYSFPRAGLAVCQASLFPKLTELTPDTVAEYLDEIAAPAAIRQAWQASAKPGRWRELYTKHAKTYVRVTGEKDEAADGAWKEPVGAKLEIVPDKDPTALAAGEDFPIHVLFEGKPLANLTVGLVHAGETGFGFLTATDAEGRTHFQIGGTGRYLLRATHLRKASANDVDWESDFATLTFQVFKLK